LWCGPCRACTSLSVRRAPTSSTRGNAQSRSPEPVPPRDARGTACAVGGCGAGDQSRRSREKPRRSLIS
jgi:hypothetical protein